MWRVQNSSHVVGKSKRCRPVSAVYNMRRVKNASHIVGKSKRCRPMSPYLVHWRREPTRFLNGLNISPKLGVQCGLFSYWSRNSSVDCRTVLVHIAPIVVVSGVFLVSCRPWRHTCSASYHGFSATCCDLVRYNAKIWRVFYDISSTSHDIYTTMHELSASFVRYNMTGLLRHFFG